MIVSFELKDDVLLALLTHGRESGRPVEALLDEMLRKVLDQPQVDSIAVEQLLTESLAAVRRWPSAEFVLEDIVPAESWKAMSTGDRKSFGKHFRKNAEGSKLAEWSHRTSGNKAVYRKL